MGESVPKYIRSGLWHEEPEADNLFAARTALCRGYDVYGEMLGRSTWADMIALLFLGEAPTPSQARALDLLAVALANPGPREASVHAAMCGAVGGSPAASALIAALAVGAGSLGGGREVALAMQGWIACGKDIAAWKARLAHPPVEPTGIFPAAEHAAGFDPHGVSATLIVKQTLAALAAGEPESHCAFLEAHREAFEVAAGCPLGLSGVAAAALFDLGLSPEAGEMLYLLLRLPGAAAHALEQGENGHKKFPFYAMQLTDGPGAKR